MKSRVGPAVAVVLLTALGCPRPSTSTSTNTPLPDANVVLDGGCSIEGYNCGQVGDCSAACGTDEACVERCQNAACGPAVDLFAAIRGCTIEKCWNRCLGGATPQCLACSNEQCATENTACEQHACPVVCAAAGDGGPSPDAGAPLMDAGNVRTGCSNIYGCMGRCLVETLFLCIGFCKSRSCTAAAETLDTLLQCADAQCDTATDQRCQDRYSTAQCQACLEERCTADWTTCSQQTCQP